jgi:hypothetical protein
MIEFDRRTPTNKECYILVSFIKENAKNIMKISPLFFSHFQEYKGVDNKMRLNSEVIHLCMYMPCGII